MLFFICPDSLIAARTQACDYPPKALTKPEISTYPFDIESIIDISPDLVLTESGISSPDQLRLMENYNINVFMFNYREVEDIFEAMLRIGDFCDCIEEASAKVDSLRNELHKIQTEGKSGKKALGLIWTDPIYVYGKNTLFSNQLKQIGLRNAVDSIFAQAYPEVSREYVLKSNPDLIFGPDFAHLDTTLFSEFPELKRIKAYQDSAIYYINGDILTRPGPRFIEAMKTMNESINE